MDSLSETRAFSSHLLEPNTTKTRMDVESLKTSARPRVRCLDVFLVMSVVFLFVVVAAVTAAGVMVATELRAETHMRPSLLTHDAGTQVGDDPGYKMQNFAYVQAIQSVLSNSTMEWAPVSYLAVSSVGTKFSFDRTLQALQTKQEDGSYFMYLDLNLTCTSAHCGAGLLTVRLEDQHRKAQLTCTVELPAGAVSTPVSKKCWTVQRLPGERQLVAQMTVTVPEKELENWKLELNSSGLGMFLVA